MNIFLIAILVVVTLIASLMVAGAFYVVRAIQVFNTFIKPEEENKPSPFALVCSSVADITARAVIAQAKATFMGKQSAAIRGESAIAGDIAEDLAAQANPLLGTVLQSFPALRKTLRRNPALADIALAKLGDVLAKHGPGGNGQKDLSHPKFNL